MQEIRTVFPGLNDVTAVSIESITPTPSWPRMRPDVQLGTSPLRMCRSVPQIVVRVTRTMSSVAAAMVGLGRSSSAFFPGPRKASAFISVGHECAGFGARQQIVRDAAQHPLAHAV